MPEIKLTKKAVEGLPSPESGQAIYWDSELSGFGVRVTLSSKSYVCQRRVNKRTVRSTIGRTDQITLVQARSIAKDQLHSMTKGEDINRSKKGAICEDVTLEQAWKDFLATRDLKDSTLSDYNWMMKKVFNDWKKKQVVDISRDMVQRRHKMLGEKRGAAQANRAMRFLRSLLNFSTGRYVNRDGKPLLSDNPVKVLSQTRAWIRLDRRRTLIKNHQLKAWYDTVQESPSTTIRDFILFVLFTGLRKGEAQKLKWETVDLKDKSFTIPETKNKTPLDLPLSNYLLTLLKKRRDADPEEIYVFPGKSKAGHLTEPKKVLSEIGKKSGVPFCMHDLRRTFITTAESLDVPHYAVKMLVNHSTGSDVTGGYIIPNVERLRKPMQKITDHFLKLCKGEAGKVIAMPGAG
ncbi:MAG: tyrosine-type recombinase/integrase [Nitrospinales bacterium]